MRENLSERIDLTVTKSLYSSLLTEADGNKKRIPAIVREKLEAAYMSKEDAKTLQKQNQLIIWLLKDLMVDSVAGTLRMRKIILGMEESKRKEELAEIREQLDSLYLKFEKYGLEIGLLGDGSR